ncbi:hypothetical protein I4U23_003953 [Adineta vaga]|nr:hypothetical protein I4U23_003953 [Adineta vaga]
MVDYGHGLIGYILTFITVIHCLLTLIISFIVLITILYNLYSHRQMKHEERITLILSGNIYLFMLIFMAGLIPINIETLIGDVYGNDVSFNLSLCVFKGYFIASMCCAIYHGFVTQAFYRLCRIVYYKKRQFQLYWFYVIVTPIQVTAAFLLLSPIMLWHDIIYLPNDYYCYIPFTKLRATLWLVFSVYGIPLTCLISIYTRIIMFIRKHSANQTIIVKRRQNRDLLAVQRIFLNIIILLTLGLPTIVLLFIYFITNVEHPLIYRTMWMVVGVSMTILSVEMAFMTPQLKNILLKRWLRNRVIHVANSTQMRINIIAR